MTSYKQFSVYDVINDEIQAMVEFIQNRIVDTNGLQQRCRQYLDEYNQVLLDQLKGATTKPTPTDGY